MCQSTWGAGAGPVWHLARMMRCMLGWPREAMHALLDGPADVAGPAALPAGCTGQQLVACAWCVCVFGIMSMRLVPLHERWACMAWFPEHGCIRSRYVYAVRICYLDRWGGGV